MAAYYNEIDPKAAAWLRELVKQGHVADGEVDERDIFKSYIVGSDQVWRNWTYDDELHSLGFFFLDFTRDMKTKRIALGRK